MDLLSLFVGIALGALGGIALGHLLKAQKQVDRILREETRFRHPAGTRSGAPTSLETAEWSSRLEQARSATYGVNHAWRSQSSAAGVMEPDETSEPDVCGIWFAPYPAHPGDVQCQKTPNHEGRCDE
jgi:hypothetical protein